MAFFRWLTLLMLLSGTNAFAGSEPPPVTDLERAIVSRPVWLNTSRALTADDLHGRVTLLDFWTLGCINCIDIIPDLKSLEQEFGHQLTVIGVHSAKFEGEKQTESIKNAVMRYGLTHPVVNDSDFAIWNAFGVKAWPTLVLLNPEGKIANVYSGEGNKAALESDIKGLLESYKGKVVTAPLPIALESAKQPQTVFRFPGKIIAVDNDSPIALKSYPSFMYIADSGHNRIIAETLDGRIFQTIGNGNEGFKDGSFEEAEFYKPQGMAYKNGLIYVADLGNHALRLIDFNNRTVSTLAGTGAEGRFLDGSHEADARKTPLSSPWDVAFWPDENHLVIAMAGAHQLWTYDISRKTVTLLAGNGQENIDDGHAPFASLAQPSGLLAAGNLLYFTDAESSSLRQFNKDDGNVTTLIGKGLFDFGYKEGGRGDARLQHALGLTGDGEHLYIADTYNNSIRRYDIKDGTLHNYAGHDARGAADGTLAEASFNEPGGITRLNNVLYVADTDNQHIRAIDIEAGKVSTLSISSPLRAEDRMRTTEATVPASLRLSPPPNEEGIKSAGSPSNLFFYVAPNVPLDVTLALKEGFHVNDTAASQLSLLSKDGTPLLGFGLDMLKAKHLRLPPLKPGKPYHLDGIVYYCPDAKGSLCLIKSLDVTLLSTGKETAVTLPVN